ncbi:MAG: cytochrome c peroxidase [Nevskia sp.]|nr:cytochrome c peroxidase [Nevskia sp.]
MADGLPGVRHYAAMVRMVVMGLCLAAGPAICSADARTGTVAAQTVAPATADAGTGAIAALGRRMFFDPSLSASGKLACSSCHDPNYAYGPPPGKAIALGGKNMDRGGTRAVPSLRYLHQVPPFAEHYHFADGDNGPGGGYTWDGRAALRREQAKLPLLAANEMANSGPTEVAERLRRSSYAEDFRRAFGRDIFDRPEAAFEAGLQALEAFQQVPSEFYPYTSKYDAFLRGQADLTDAEERGVALFKDPAKGNCASCHGTVIRDGGLPTFTDFDYINVGVPRNPKIEANADPAYFDLGLCGPARTDLATRKELCGYFRSPSVRNVAIRDAFFHNGVFHSLREVLHFYVERDIKPEKWYPRNADGSVHKFDDLPPGAPDNVDHDAPLNRKPGDSPALTDAEIEDLIAFLQTLTDGYHPGPDGS